MHTRADRLDRTDQPTVPTGLAVTLVVLSLVVAGAAVVAVARRAEPPSQPAAGASVGNPVATGEGVLPSTLGGLPATVHVTGQDAVDVVAGLHLGDVPVDEAEVAEYGSGREVVWVSRSGTVSADTLVTQMTDRIAQGDTPFSTPRKVPTLRGVFRTVGNDQVHYYFARGEAVWWLAADRALARQALAEILGAAA